MTNIVVIEKGSEAFNHLAKAFDNTQRRIYKVSIEGRANNTVAIKVNEGMWSPTLMCSVSNKLTTRTYAVGVEAVDISLAGSIIDLHGELNSISPMGDEDAGNLTEYHVTCTGPASLHSAMLEHFEWTGK